jgi:hypothetical protein
MVIKGTQKKGNGRIRIMTNSIAKDYRMYVRGDAEKGNDSQRGNK